MILYCEPFIRICTTPRVGARYWARQLPPGQPNLIQLRYMSVANMPGSWRNECLDSEWEIWVLCQGKFCTCQIDIFHRSIVLFVCLFVNGARKDKAILRKKNKVVKNIEWRTIISSIKWFWENWRAT